MVSGAPGAPGASGAPGSLGAPGSPGAPGRHPETSVLSRLGFTVLLFLLRSLVSMNFNVVYIYTAEVRCVPPGPPSRPRGPGLSGPLCSSGLPHRGPLSGDGLLHLLQPHRRDDRALHRSGGPAALRGAFRRSSHRPLRLLQVLMSRSVVQALSPFALASVLCALGSVLLPIETRGRALLVSNLLSFLTSS